MPLIVNEWRIGDVRVTRVEEMSRPVSRPAEWFTDYNAEELEPHVHWLSPRFYLPDDDRLVSSVHSWVLRTKTRTILIDTCTGNHKQRPGWAAFHELDTPFLERLHAAGVDSTSVDLVLCTHLHIDHVGWNTFLDNGRWVPTFPNARYLMASADLDYFAKAANDGQLSPASANTYYDSVLPIVEAGLVTIVKGDEDLGEGLRLVPAPGHTPGQVRLDLTSQGSQATFAGDVLHNPLQVPLWHWRTRVCVDPEQACVTRKQVLEHCASTGSLLMPAHFPLPSAGRIRHAGDAFSIAFDD